MTESLKPHAERATTSVPWRPGYATRVNSTTGLEERGNCLGMVVTVRCPASGRDGEANYVNARAKTLLVTPNQTSMFDIVGEGGERTLALEPGHVSAGWRIVEAKPLR